MFLIILTLTLTVLKYFEFSFMSHISWGWIVGLFAFTFLWFEFFERMLGFDKRKAHKKFDKIQQDRAKKTFERQKPK